MVDCFSHRYVLVRKMRICSQIMHALSKGRYLGLYVSYHTDTLGKILNNCVGKTKTQEQRVLSLHLVEDKLK